MSTLRAYYWLLLSAPAGELYSEMFQAANDREAVRVAWGEARDSLPAGVHRIAVSGIRSDGGAYVIEQLTVEAGAVACA